MAVEAHDFLAHHKLAEFQRPPKIVTVPGDATVTEAIKILADADILCAPVTNPGAGSEHWRDKYLGVVHMAMLARFLLSHLAKMEGSSSGSRHDTGLHHLLALKSLQSTKLADLPDKSGFDRQFDPLEESDTLLSACKRLGTMNVYRVPVVDAEGHLVNFLTQSVLVRALADNLDHLPVTAQKTLRELHLTQPSTVVYAERDLTAFLAFQLMKEQGVNGMPILDENGAVIANLSIRDLRQVITSPRLYEALHRPVTEFVAANVPDAFRSEMYPIITCQAEATLGEVVERLSTSRIHRIYVCDAQKRPIRVISLSDVLAALSVPNAD